MWFWGDREDYLLLFDRYCHQRPTQKHCSKRENKLILNVLQFQFDFIWSRGSLSGEVLVGSEEESFEVGNSTMAASASTSSPLEEEITLTVKWSGKEYTVRVCGDDSVAELKRRICELTNVLPKRQKLLYPKVGSKLADDSLLLSQLPLKSSLKMTMIGFGSLSFNSSVVAL